MKYVCQYRSWPNFTWQPEVLLQPLTGVRHKEGRLTGRVESPGFKVRSEAVLQTLTQDVLKSSEINTEKDSLNITGWLQRFFACMSRDLDATGKTLGGVLNKASFWDTYHAESFNQRQHLLLSKILYGFEGKLTNSKWAKIAKCSQDTALRDIQDLINRGILLKDSAGGRSTGYLVKAVDK